jgi:Uma2 family endonuclease
MRAVIVDPSQQEIEKRRRLGLDRFDEMWEGVYHMVPAPEHEHQRVVQKLVVFLDLLATRKSHGTICLQENVFEPGKEAVNYRIPDLAWIGKGHEDRIRKSGIHGGPDAVVEVRSPGDETYDKLDFYARIGTGEVVVVDRDTKVPEVFRLAGTRMVAVAADREGWVVSERLRVRMRVLKGAPPKIVVEDLDDPASRAEI